MIHTFKQYLKKTKAKSDINILVERNNSQQDKVNNADSAFICLIILLTSRNGQVGQVGQYGWSA